MAIITLTLFDGIWMKVVVEAEGISGNSFKVKSIGNFKLILITLYEEQTILLLLITFFLV